ncbi:hypothetical protein K474DRAFT_1704942 [Panus rudis PR-1116 ss-1]|nr:hypothetical protein K474DRAFT_1704942 [Panus rudis PR-1116 ss-1]
MQSLVPSVSRHAALIGQVLLSYNSGVAQRSFNIKGIKLCPFSAEFRRQLASLARVATSRGSLLSSHKHARFPHSPPNIKGILSTALRPRTVGPFDCTSSPAVKQATIAEEAPEGWLEDEDSRTAPDGWAEDAEDDGIAEICHLPIVIEDPNEFGVNALSGIIPSYAFAPASYKDM